jgi:hypothetical protein
MSSPGNYAKGYVRWTTGGKRVMWDGCRWQQLCKIEKCFRRDQKSQGVCLLHFREQEESKTKPKSKKSKSEEKPDKIKLNKDKKSSQTKTTSISTRSKRTKLSSKSIYLFRFLFWLLLDSLHNLSKVSNTDINASDSEITKRKSSVKSKIKFSDYFEFFF